MTRGYAGQTRWLLLLETVAAALVAACSQPAIGPARAAPALLAVDPLRAACQVTGEADLDELQAPCGRPVDLDLMPYDAGASPLHVQVSSTPAVVRSGEQGTLVLRARNTGSKPIEVVASCRLPPRIYALDGAPADVETPNDAPEHLCTTRTWLVLAPGSALRVSFTIDAWQYGTRFYPGCEDNPGSCSHATGVVRVRPLDPGAYNLEVALPWRAPPLRVPLTVVAADSGQGTPLKSAHPRLFSLPTGDVASRYAGAPAPLVGDHDIRALLHGGPRGPGRRP